MVRGVLNVILLAAVCLGFHTTSASSSSIAAEAPETVAAAQPIWHDSNLWSSKEALQNSRNNRYKELNKLDLQKYLSNSTRKHDSRVMKRASINKRQQYVHQSTRIGSDQIRHTSTPLPLQSITMMNQDASLSDKDHKTWSSSSISIYQGTAENVVEKFCSMRSAPGKEPYQLHKIAIATSGISLILSIIFFKGDLTSVTSTTFVTLAGWKQYDSICNSVQLRSGKRLSA